MSHTSDAKVSCVCVCNSSSVTVFVCL